MAFSPDDDFLSDLKQTFLEEAAEHLASLNHLLLTIEKSEDRTERQGLLKEIFRKAHSLKGGAAVVGLDEIQKLAHLLESLFSVFQKQDQSIEAATLDVVYETLDGIGLLLRQSEGSAEQNLDSSPLLSKLESVLTSIGAVETESPSHAASSESSEASREDAARDTEEKALMGAAHPGTESVRVATSKLDDLMGQLAELLVASAWPIRVSAELAEIVHALDELLKSPSKNRIDLVSRPPSEDDGSGRKILGRLNALQAQIRADARKTRLVMDRLQEGVRRTRMFPLSTVLDSFPRMVRDLARDQGKAIRFVVAGGDAELDRAVLEEIKAPLTHLIRNCVDHGLETPEERSSAGKGMEGTLSVSATQVGDNVLIEVKDDGRGIDAEKVKTAAVEKRLLSPDEAQAMDSREVLSLIFRPGFSTSPIITDISGRGVGLDVVRQNIEQMSGTIELETKVGSGTAFSLMIPLTIATTLCVLVRAGQLVFGLPVANVARTMRVALDDVRDAQGQQAIVTSKQPIPLKDLARILGLEGARWDQGYRSVVVVRSAERTVGLLVDEILRVEELVVKALPTSLGKIRFVGGASLLGGREVVMILNIAEIVRGAIDSVSDISSLRRRKVGDSTGIKVMIADDSITTRTLERNILQAAGYEVRVAGDGAAAWGAIQADPPDIVVSDVEMPGMDGFELTQKIRESERLKHLPVVLVTSLESAADRQRGVDVGADAYIGKSNFDQEHLLDVVRRLI